MHGRHTFSRKVISSVAVSGALIAAAPALAQVDVSPNETPEISYEERAVVQGEPAQYAEPIYGSEPQVQPVEYEDERREMRRPHRVQRAPMYYDQTVQGGYPRHTVGAAVYFPQDGYPAGAVHYPAQAQYGQMPQYDEFERDEWLEDCRARYEGGRYNRRSSRSTERGQVLGGLLGAGVGGLIGNRIAGRGNRLGGTLIGAGVGGLAGVVAGGALGRSSDGRDARDECEAYLIQHDAQWRQPSYGYGPVMLVPIMVPVEQRAVIREYVTHEWVEETVMVEAPAQKRVRTIPVKTVPVKTKTVKSVKGN